VFFPSRRLVAYILQVPSALYVVDFGRDFCFIFCAAFGVKKPKETMNTAKIPTADAGEFI
jgi:hypothetical protein